MQTTMKAEDHWYARRLPDDFLARSGDTVSRLSKIVTENWWGHDGAELTLLVRLLLPVLEPLKGGDTGISDELREQCVELVDQWLAATVRQPE